MSDKTHLNELTEKEQMIIDKTNDYLEKMKTAHGGLLDSSLSGDFKKWISHTHKIVFYYSFVFDEKIKLEEYFADKKNIATLHRLYSEIYQNTLGIYSCLKVGNPLGVFCLYRTILERIVTLKIFFEDPKEEEVIDRITKYRDLGGVLVYKYAKETNDQKLVEEYQGHFDEYSDTYKHRNYFDYSKSVYGKPQSMNSLLKRFGIDNEDNHTYGMLSIANHGSILSNNLLNEKCGLLPSTDLDRYKKTFLMVLMSMIWSFEGLVDYIGTGDAPVLTFLKHQFMETSND